jgi:predicted nucleic acid-binding protein
VIVIDASAVVEMLMNTPAGQRVASVALAPEETLHAPHLLDLEVVQVLRRYSRAGDLGPRRAGQAIQDLLDLPIERYPHDLILPRIWELRNNFTAYDAAYLSLAEALGAPLLTRDAALAQPGSHRARVMLL